MKKSFLSTQEVANILKVDQSTVKRWTESGTLTCQKTPGGHRKFKYADIMSFMQKFPIVETGIITTHDVKENNEAINDAILKKNYGFLSRHLQYLLINKGVDEVTDFFKYLYFNNISIADIYDQIIREAMFETGKQWEENLIGVEDEHYRTALVTGALQRFQQNIVLKPSNGLVAICGCPDNELHELGILCLSSLLKSEGWKVYYLGVNLPVESFLSAVNTFKPALICVSSTYTYDEEQLRENTELLFEAANNTGSKLLLGGEGFKDEAEYKCHAKVNSYVEAIAYTRNEFLNNKNENTN